MCIGLSVCGVKCYPRVKSTAWGCASDVLLVSQVPGIQTPRQFPPHRPTLRAKKIKGPKRGGLAFLGLWRPSLSSGYFSHLLALFLLSLIQGTKSTMDLLKVCFL